MAKKLLIWLGVIACLSFTACTKNNPVSPQVNQTQQKFKAQGTTRVGSIKLVDSHQTDYSIWGVAANPHTLDMFGTQGEGYNQKRMLFKWLGGSSIKEAGVFDSDDPAITYPDIVNPQGVTYESAYGELWVCDHYPRILRFDPNTMHATKQISFGSDCFPTGVAVRPMYGTTWLQSWKRLYITNGQRLRVLDVGAPAGQGIDVTYDGYWAGSPLLYKCKYQNPTYIIYKAGALWVSDYAGNKVIHLDANKPDRALSTISIQGPRGLAIDKYNLLFVASDHTPLMIYNPDGTSQLGVGDIAAGFHSGLAIGDDTNSLFAGDDYPRHNSWRYSNYARYQINYQ